MKPHVIPLAVALSIVFCFETLRASPQNRKACADPPRHLDEVLGLRTAPGAFVVDFDPGGPAEKVGLDVCDLIVAFNGQDFRHYGELQAFAYAMREAAMFSEADLEVWRQSDSSQARHQDGLKLRIPLQPGARIGSAFSFQVLVLGVVKGGPADVAGVRAGEFIDQVNGQKVSESRSVVELDQRVSETAKRKGKVLLTLARWQPVRGSADYKTSYDSREVWVEVQQSREE